MQHMGRLNTVARHGFINQHAKNVRHRVSPRGSWLGRTMCFSPT